MLFFFLLTVVGAAPAPGGYDLERAIEVRPGSAFLGENSEDVSAVLNKHLKTLSIPTVPCANFTLDELNQVQDAILDAMSPEFNKVYVDAKDNRALRFSVEERYSFWEKEATLVKENPDYYTMTRDGKCHETVMLFIHHLTSDMKEEVGQLTSLPLLPPKSHRGTMNVHHPLTKGYKMQASCFDCHAK